VAQRPTYFPDLQFKPGADLMQVFWCPQIQHERYSNPEPMVLWRDLSDIKEPLVDIPPARFPTPAEKEEEEQARILEADLEWLKSFETSPDSERQFMAFFKRIIPHSSLTHIPPWFLEMPVGTDEDFENVRNAARRLVAEFGRPEFIPKFACEAFIPHLCRFSPERVVEYPQELTEEDEAQLKSLPIPTPTFETEMMTSDFKLTFYYRQLSAAYGTKLQGHVVWSQGPEEVRCSEGHLMEHLLTIASSEWDGANWPRWQPIGERELYERLSSEGQYEAARALHSPMGVTLGDMASKHVFVCRKCSDWPIKPIIQD
jgi:hypothetical protein